MVIPMAGAVFSECFQRRAREKTEGRAASPKQNAHHPSKIRPSQNLHGVLAANQQARLPGQDSPAPRGGREIAQAGTQRRKRGKAWLEELLEIAVGATAYCQPTPKNGVEQNQNADWTQFQKWFQIAHAVAATVSPFQSPTFRAIM